jgi:hypothetical protein
MPRRNRIFRNMGAMRAEPEIRRQVQADRSIQTAEPWETMSNPGIQTSLAWVAKMALIAKCRRLAKPNPRPKIDWSDLCGGFATRLQPGMKKRARIGGLK